MKREIRTNTKQGSRGEQARGNLVRSKDGVRELKGELRRLAALKNRGVRKSRQEEIQRNGVRSKEGVREL